MITKRLAVTVLAAAMLPLAAATPVHAASSPPTTRIYLSSRDPAGLAAYAAAVSQPNNPNYHHYLTPPQFQRRFGPTPPQVAAVKSWLTTAGFHITTTTQHYIAITTTKPIDVPASLTPDILTVTTPPTTSRPDPTPINVGTCSAYYGQKTATSSPPAYGQTPNYDVCGYTPGQLRSAYGVAGSGLTGRGVTVAVVLAAASPTITQDSNTYFAHHGLPTWRPNQFSQNLPADIGTACPSQPSYGEESLDVEAVHTMAPDANLVYVGADCTNLGDDLLDAETRVVDHHLADIVSNSWHLADIENQIPDSLIAAYQQIFQQGAVEGIGFYFASGDHGDWTHSTPSYPASVDYPASDPWVTAVGGTTLAIGQHANYEWETSWGDDLAPLSADGKTWIDPPGTFQFGGGGGPSAKFAQPFYQRGIVPDALSHPNAAAKAARVLPDIAADADLATGMLIGRTATLTPDGSAQYGEERAYGTSEATPLIAGIQADAQQAAHGIPIGFANPAVYARYNTGAYHDITDPSSPIAVVDQERDTTTGAITTGLGTLARDPDLTAAPGYDDATGVGTPTQRYLDSYAAP
ncbi:MAG TPA: S53 family peptidase [Pseudonocardiaceae bacterium]|nr:S53 family peptidase [Pseudonocardiaceae bacterium]